MTTKKTQKIGEYPAADKMQMDLTFLMECFREILVEHGEEKLLPYLPWGKNRREDSGHFPEQIAQAYSICFNLLNMTEENAAAQMRRIGESREGLSGKAGMWGHSLKILKENKFSENEILKCFPKIHVEPVLTAHPTEAKRATVLEHHRKLYLLLVQKENTMWTQFEQKNIREQIKTVLERLWLTGEIFFSRVDVESELRNIIHYLKSVFPDSVNLLDRRFILAWENAGFDSKKITDPDQLPSVTFGTWVGGDRDGHPFVTTEVTKNTLIELRKAAIDLIKENLRNTASKLSISDRIQKPSKEMAKRIDELTILLGEKGVRARSRNPDESFRQFLNLISEAIPSESLEQAGMVCDSSNYVFKEETGIYKSPKELYNDLQIMIRTLRSTKAYRLWMEDIFPLMRIVKTFGFHLASLDVRQNSMYHDRALSQMMISAGMSSKDYPEWPLKKKILFLNRELRSTRPFALPSSHLGDEADSVLGCFRVITQYIKNFGYEGIGSFIISMTRSVADLLTVYIFARESGLMINTPEGPVCPVPVVPLFETIDDLQKSPEIVEEFLNHPITQRSLKYIQKIKGYDQPTQQIMIGYSDSNKDGGIITSMWNLFLAQRRIDETAKKLGFTIKFFHGRGGTISRGAGPTYRFLDALPTGTLHGDIRLTEQGETISQKYANKISAVYNLELLTAGVTKNTLLYTHGPRIPKKYEEIMNLLSEKSRETYEELVHSDSFISFFREATPIDAIELFRLGSRPSRRTGNQSLNDLRAIPWVFSWNQSRFFITGWFGAGRALEFLEKKYQEDFKLVREHLHERPAIRYILTNVETSIATANLDVMRKYSNLVTDQGLRKKIFSLIEAEYELTIKMLNRIMGGTLDSRRPKFLRTLELREEALFPLHNEQIALLKKWRALKKGNKKEAEQYLIQIQFTINSIASGLRTTG
ncbi:MAG: phosphoenolpyruvate carboxylase [Spirochaetia bacterium]|nr:phosphoenolpyruvate carboxylase [Spirochaetia bacterium]